MQRRLETPALWPQGAGTIVLLTCLRSYAAMPGFLQLCSSACARPRGASLHACSGATPARRCRLNCTTANQCAHLARIPGSLPGTFPI